MECNFSEEDFSCPVCREIFKNPVLLGCSHSVCEMCVKRYWQKKGFRECPICRKVSFASDPPLNLALRNLCESFSEQISRSSSSGCEAICRLHREKLKLFCLDDQQPVCLVCRDSATHTNHKLCPIDETVKDFKKELQTALRFLQDKLKIFEDCKMNWSQTAEYIKIQAQHTGCQIREQFEQLHQFLRAEEAVRITVLREEEEQKSQMIKKKIEKLNRDVASILDTIRAIKRETRAEDIQLLQNYKATVERTQCKLHDPEELSGALIHVAKHLANLKFKVWEKMQDTVQYTPVTLDPNTAYPMLIVSNDLTSVSCSFEKQNLPDHPERFDELPCILGSEGFNSGTHCWDVEVTECTNWFVGMMTETSRRKGRITNRSGIWCVVYYDNKYRVGSTPQTETLTYLSVAQKLQVIRVKLDWDRGELSFSNPLTNTHLHTFTHTFDDKLLPFVLVSCKQYPVKFLPFQCSLRVIGAA